VAGTHGPAAPAAVAGVHGDHDRTALLPVERIYERPLRALQAQAKEAVQVGLVLALVFDAPA
jgi:hypothetical protein